MPRFKKEHFPTLVTWTSPDGKTHVPPDPPLIEGCPPWFPRVNEYRRAEPLKKCPEARCRRAGRCVSLLYDKFCQKTHMEHEAFRQALCDKIDRLMKEKLGDDWECGPLDPNEPVPTPPREMKLALQAAAEKNERAALLKWQTEWLDGVKARYGFRPDGTPTSKAARGHRRPRAA